MTSFLIIIIVFIISCVFSSASKKSKYQKYIEDTTSNCRKEYEIGCKEYRNFVELYLKYGGKIRTDLYNNIIFYDDAKAMTTKEAIEKVARHYNLPTDDEVKYSSHNFGTNTSSLGGLIFDYAQREIKKLGFASAQKVFVHFKSEPTEEDFKLAEECDTFTVRSSRTKSVDISIEKKYPWLKSDSEKKEDKK
ncbi:MAG: hypothetical protein RR313_12705 [Anaerovoracaceae bacterium]